MLKVSSRLRRGIEGFEDISKGLKRFQRASKDIGDFKGGFEGFEGVSHDKMLLSTHHPLLFACCYTPSAHRSS